MDKRVIVAVTGASGAVYAERLIAHLAEHISRVYVVFTNSGRMVAQHELSDGPTDISLSQLAAGQVPEQYRSIIRLFSNDDLFAPIASGTSAADAMVIMPCSMGTLARVSQGISGNLIERAADVCLKEKVPLLLAPRETPLNTIHLRHLLALSELGVHIIPAMPGFYHRPKSVDDLVNFVVGKTLDALKIPHNFYHPWNARMR